uniref:BTB domain-containing protein n=1 Tax=Syphacia muris TaxID=451379 RepID=A0A0N5ANJ8_9BILA
MSRAQVPPGNSYGGQLPRINPNAPSTYGPPMPPTQPVLAKDLHHINEIVSLNVGGIHFQTLYDTVASRSSGFFSHIFRIDPSGRVLVMRQHIIEDDQGRVFINRDGRLFSYILQYLRDESRMVLPEKIQLLHELKREAEFFAIDRLRLMIEQRLLELEGQRNLRYERLDSLAQTVQQISQQMYISNFKK